MTEKKNRGLILVSLSTDRGGPYKGCTIPQIHPTEWHPCIFLDFGIILILLSYSSQRPSLTLSPLPLTQIFQTLGTSNNVERLRRSVSLHLPWDLDSPNSLILRSVIVLTVGPGTSLTYSPRWLPLLLWLGLPSATQDIISPVPYPFLPQQKTSPLL